MFSSPLAVKSREFQSHLTPLPCLHQEVPLWKSELDWDLEIGCGNGEFSLHRALKFPFRQIIAIEKTRNKIRKIKNPPKNLWVLHTNAVWWVSHFAPKNFFRRIFILYPNIYIKNKQAHLRWVRRSFMSYLLERLKVTGTIEIRTNQNFYYQEVKEKMKDRFSYMKCVSDQSIVSEVSETAFERKYLSRGDDCWSLIFQKSNTCSN